MQRKTKSAETMILGGGMAGLSAGIYLGRASRDALLIDEGKSMARWEPDVQNYLGFPEGISGTELLRRGKAQVRRYSVQFARDRILWARAHGGKFSLRGNQSFYTCRRLLLATGIFHLPPDIPGVSDCLGHSLFYCKDCDGYRVRGKRVGIYGWNNQAVEYALGMLLYSSVVTVLTDGHSASWDQRHDCWLQECRVPVLRQPIRDIRREGHLIQALKFEDKSELCLDALFTTRGDVYFNQIAKELGAKVDEHGEILVDEEMRTSVRGLYAAGCVTPSNCQMIIAAGQGAAAAQAINRDLLEESLATKSLRRLRSRQLRSRPVLRPANV